MWKAILRGRVDVGGATRVTVEFSDGINSVTEQCVPQNKEGFEHWVKSRLETFNSSKIIEQTYPINQEVSVSEPQEPEVTADEAARIAWFNDFFRLERVQKLIDLGIVLPTNAKVVALKDKIKAGLRPEYIDSI
jgi:hypothetical protein